MGLKNAGATCYMNAVFQQLFMQPSIRALVLGAREVPPAERDASVFHQLQARLRPCLLPFFVCADSSLFLLATTAAMRCLHVSPSLGLRAPRPPGIYWLTCQLALSKHSRHTCITRKDGACPESAAFQRSRCTAGRCLSFKIALHMQVAALPFDPAPSQPSKYLESFRIAEIEDTFSVWQSAGPERGIAGGSPCLARWR